MTGLDRCAWCQDELPPSPERVLAFLGFIFCSDACAERWAEGSQGDER